MGSKSESSLRSADGFRAFLALFVVGIVGLAMIGAPIIYGGATTTATATESPAEFKSYQTASQAGSDLGPADEVYLGEDGSAVLRYDSDMNDLNRLEVGADVSEGLAYMLATGDYEETDEFEEGSFSAVLDQNGITGNGSFVMQQPEDLERLDLDVSGEVSDETNEFEATATGAFAGEDSTPTTVETDGHVSVTADRLETSGSATVAAESPMTTSDGQTLDVSLQETSDGYVLDVTDERTVSSFSASNWETREKAKQTLTERYASFAMQLGGDSEVTIENYDFEERSDGQHRLELEFTIEYTGIDSGIEQLLPVALMNDDTAGLSQSEAQAIATGVTDLEIETIDVRVEDRGDSMNAEWNVQISNYDELTLAMLDATESAASDEELEQMNIEEVRSAIEAQQAANLETTVDWDASLEQTSSQELQFDVEVVGDTENWGTYIDELESRDIQSPNDVSFDLSADTDGDRLSIDGEFELKGQDLAGQAVTAMAESAQTGPTGTMDPRTEQFITALSDADLQVARVDADVGDGTVRLEGGAKFDDMSALTDTVTGTMAVSGAATTTSGDTASMYVYVEDMGGVDTASATKSDIEHLAVVDSETTVHQAGEWDAEFPEVDTEGMGEYLGLEVDDDGVDESDAIRGTDDGDESDDSSDEKGDDVGDSDDGGESDDSSDDESDDVGDADGGNESDEMNNESDGTDNESDDSDDSVPGFGPGIALASIAGLLTALLVRRRN